MAKVHQCVLIVPPDCWLLVAGCIGVEGPQGVQGPQGYMYGAQFWLVPDDREDVSKSAYTTAGNRGQYVVIIPSHDTVIVRRGLDYGKQGFDKWDLTREVLRAIEPIE